MHGITDIKERLREARKSLGYTQDAMGKAIGSTLRTWQDYESGKSKPGSNALAGIVGVGVNVNWLLTGEGPMLIKDLQGAAPGAFDAESLRLAVETVEEGLEITDREMTVAKKAELVEAVYELFVEMEGKVDRATVLKLVISTA